MRHDFPEYASRQRSLLRVFETNMALEFEPDDHNGRSVPFDLQHDANTTCRADALNILNSSDDVSTRLECCRFLVSRVRSNGSVLSGGLTAVSTVPGISCGCLVRCSLFDACVKTNLLPVGGGFNADLPAPVERYHIAMEVRRHYVRQHKLLQDSPQARAVEYLSTVLTDAAWMRLHCSAVGYRFYDSTLIVIRETFAVQTFRGTTAI
jgi:hypothetical protein